MMRFEGKKIVVSGASSGIGREACISLSRLGADVVLVARDEKRLQETISLMDKGEHKYISYDFENVENIKTLVEECVIFNGIKLDGYVHCVGVPSVYPLRVIDYEKFEKTMKINTYSYLEMIKHMSKKNYSNDGASIVFISSILTKKVNYKGQSLYIASKIAGESLSKSLSLELEKRKIRINSVICGGVKTKMDEETQVYRSLNTQDKQVGSNARYLSPEEVSNMALFLLSDSARYIVGEDYYMDGGHI